MTITPLGDRVLIRPEANPDQTASGLHLVEHRKPETAGWIVSLGRRVNPERLNPGDYVAFSWQSGQELYVDEERYLMMRETDVLAVLQDGEETRHGG